MTSLLTVLLSLSLLVFSAQARTVNIEASVVCRSDLLPFLPERVRQICSSLHPPTSGYYSHSGQNYLAISTLTSQSHLVKRDEGGNLDGPEHLFIRFGRSS